MDLRQRKKNRLDGFDYSRNGMYFITVCVKDRHPMLWKASTDGNDPYDNDVHVLSEYGVAVNDAIHDIPHHYSGVSVEQYVIMPNHIHMILVLSASRERSDNAPSVSTVVNQLKGNVTRAIGFSLWQKSFHDRFVRDKQEYQRVREYIESNPAKWKEDDLFAPTDM